MLSASGKSPPMGHRRLPRNLYRCIGGSSMREVTAWREVAGIGVLLLDASGIAAAVSVIGLRQRFDPARRKHVVEAIRAACADIQGLTLFPPVDERPARKVAKGAARRGLRAVNTER